MGNPNFDKKKKKKKKKKRKEKRERKSGICVSIHSKLSKWRYKKKICKKVAGCQGNDRHCEVNRGKRLNKSERETSQCTLFQSRGLDLPAKIFRYATSEGRKKIC